MKLNNSNFQQILTFEFLLPLHLYEHVIALLKEISDLCSLLISFSSIVDSLLSFPCQVITDFRDGEYNLLHSAVMAYNLRFNKES